MITALVLTNLEQYIAYLDPDRLLLEETQEAGGVATLKVTYYLADDEDCDDLFRLGNKVWVQGHESLKDCLYVLNTKVKEDIDEHYAEFEAEEVLVELNYAPPTSQTYLTTANFNMNSGNVIVDRKALDYWFGHYYNIGVVQNCLSESLSKMTFTGSITLMSLLRGIEEATGNTFTTEYEKDPVTNEIHRYLNFLNPTNQTTGWSFKAVYDFPISEETPSKEEDVGSYDTTDDETDYYEDTKEVILSTLPGLDPSKTYVKILEGIDSEISSWKLSSLGVTGDEDALSIYIRNSYSIVDDNPQYNLSCQVNSKVWDTSTSSYTIVTGEEDIIASPENLIPDRFVLQIVDVTNDILYYEHVLTPVLSKTHKDILDLNYNVENLDVEIDETDSYPAVAPIIDAGTNEYTTAQINTITSNWLNLEVTKGDVIPMIVEKVKSNSSNPSSTVSSNYWSRCINNQATDGYDCWHGTAYWSAPFSKRAGEMWVEDEVNTGLKYDMVTMRPEYGRDEAYPKTDTVTTTAEDKYAIYNAVAMHLKEIRNKEVRVETDVANLRDGRYNDYNTYDKVYLKIPGSQELVSAMVTQTVKNANEPGQNTVKLNNYSNNTKFTPSATYLTGRNVSYTYPGKGTLTVTLKDINTEETLTGKLVSFSVYTLDPASKSETYKTTANLTTDSTGKAKYTTGFEPGEYKITATFGGDDLYEAVSEVYYVNVGGKITVAQDTTTNAKKTSNKTNKTNKKKKKTKTVKVKRYYTRYGLSPDKKHKYICAIGKPSARGEVSKYGHKFWKTVFYNKCPACGKASLYWGIFWAGNESANWGKFPATGRQEGGSAEGHIFCKNCDADYSVFGKSHDNYARKLKVYKKPVKSSRTEAYKLKKGKLYYDTITKTVKRKKNSTTKNYTPKANISKKVKSTAISVAKGKTGLAAAKLIANWVQTNIKYQHPMYSDFRKSPDKVLSTRKGNCCDQTRLMLEMMDAVGVTQKYKLQYVFVCCNSGNGYGHVFGKIGSKYADPCRSRYRGQAWGHYLTSYGRLGSGKTTTYPSRPF